MGMNKENKGLERSRLPHLQEMRELALPEKLVFKAHRFEGLVGKTGFQADFQFKQADGSNYPGMGITGLVVLHTKGVDIVIQDFRSWNSPASTQPVTLPDRSRRNQFGVGRHYFRVEHKWTRSPGGRGARIEYFSNDPTGQTRNKTALSPNEYPFMEHLARRIAALPLNSHIALNPRQRKLLEKCAEMFKRSHNIK
ncbi:hypothetical protein KJ765_02640 [Candidatus Micrarchaeota archaeon]|nr:hypothetical protein [Candidatus Micrarchaeota archaeon]